MRKIHLKWGALGTPEMKKWKNLMENPDIYYCRGLFKIEKFKHQTFFYSLPSKMTYVVVSSMSQYEWTTNKWSAAVMLSKIKKIKSSEYFLTIQSNQKSLEF